MLTDLNGPPANPSSVHWFGQRARQYLMEARTTAASFFQAKPEEVLFTSGGTEGINFLLRGLKNKGHIVSTAIEHSAVYQTLQSLKEQGWEITFVPVGLWGAPLPDLVEKAIQGNTQAIVLAASNSETGVKTDLYSIAAIAHKKGIPLLVDAVSYTGKEPLPRHEGISAFAISGHKFHAPKGIGAVWIRPSLKLYPLNTGGSQEHQRRAGTENLAGILGLAEALRILREEQTLITEHLCKLRDHLEGELLRHLPDLLIHGQGPRVSNTSNLSFLGVDGETLLMQLDLAGIAVSHGSACSSGSLEPSRVLMQMGIDRKVARSALRFSVGKFNTKEEIDQALERIVEIVKKLRHLHR